MRLRGEYDILADGRPSDCSEKLKDQKAFLAKKVELLLQETGAGETVSGSLEGAVQ